MITSIQAKGCKPELPANTVWKKNSAPAERLALIEQDIVTLESHSLQAVRRGSLTRDEQAKLMKEFSKVEREISTSQPKLAKSALVYKKRRTVPQEIGPSESFFDGQYQAVETSLTKENYYINRSWNRSIHKLLESAAEVEQSIKEPGNSFEQTRGIILKRTADEKIFKEFTSLRKEWSKLTNQAYQVRKNGFSKIA